MLDTDISSYIIKKRPTSLLERFEKHAERLCVSVITAAELQFGAEKAGRPALTDLWGRNIWSALLFSTGRRALRRTTQEFALLWKRRGSRLGTWIC